MVFPTPARSSSARLLSHAVAVVGLAPMVVAACVAAPPALPALEVGTETSSTSTSTSSVAGENSSAATSTTLETGADETTTGAETGGSTGDECRAGQAGCACIDGRTCEAGLVCRGARCVDPACGDGRIDPDEACDDANRVDADGCDNDCTVSAGAAEMAMGNEHVCVLFHTGQIKCWGNYFNGQLGYPGVGQDIGDDETPADMPFVDLGGAVVRQLALGSNFSCALLQDDTVKCWGDGQHGRTGQGSPVDLGTNEAPADIPAIELGGAVEQISAGDQHACAVLADGGVRCWGRNDWGQLGLPGVVALGDDELPTDAPLVDVGAATSWVVAGQDHTCAVLSDGGVLCWGRDSAGQLCTPSAIESVGDDETPSTSTPVALNGQLALIEAGHDHTCVTYAGGGVQCWGEGSSGRLGNGDTDPLCDDEALAGVPALLFGAAQPIDLAAGSAHTCVGLDDGQIHCWGEAANGRLGYGDGFDRFAPGGDSVPIGLGVPARSVAAGRFSTCAVTQDSRVKCWGRNNRGQLGYGSAWDTDLGIMEPLDVVGEVMLE